MIHVSNASRSSSWLRLGIPVNSKARAWNFSRTATPRAVLRPSGFLRACAPADCSALQEIFSIDVDLVITRSHSDQPLPVPKPQSISQRTNKARQDKQHHKRTYSTSSLVVIDTRGHSPTEWLNQVK